MKLCIACLMATVALLGGFVMLRADRATAEGLMPEVVSTARAPRGDVPEVTVTAAGPESSAAGPEVSMDPRSGVAAESVAY